MNIRQLECFNAVIRYGTMTKAAKEIGISQPAISNMIASLEHEIGFKLFERNGARLSATPEARYFLHDVERTVGSFDQARQTARAILNRNFGRLVIASYPGMSMHFLPRVVARFMAERPGVQVELHSRSSEVLHEILLTHRYDIAIADLPVAYPGIRAEPMTLECQCIVPKRHRLAGLSVITPQDLDGVPMISLFRENRLTYKLASIFAAAKVDWNVVAETRLFESACAFVGHGTGIAIVDALTASEHAGTGLIAKPFKPRVTFDIGLLYPPDQPVAALLGEFIDLLRASIRPYLASSRRNKGNTTKGG